MGNLDWFGLPDSTDVAHTESVECGGAGDCDRYNAVCTCECIYVSACGYYAVLPCQYLY